MLMMTGPWSKRGPAGAPPPLLRTMCRNLQQATCGQQAMQDVIIVQLVRKLATAALHATSPCTAAVPWLPIQRQPPPSLRRQPATLTAGGCTGTGGARRHPRSREAAGAARQSGGSTGPSTARRCAPAACRLGRRPAKVGWCQQAGVAGAEGQQSSSWAWPQDSKHPCCARAAARTPRTSLHQPAPTKHSFQSTAH